MGRKSNLLLMGSGGADVTAASTAFVQGQNGAIVDHGYGAGTQTVSNQNGNSTLPDCLFLCAFLSTDGTDPASLQIGSTSLTRLSTTGQGVQLWGASVSSGETDDITFTNGNAYNRYGVKTAWFTGPAMTLTPTDIDQTTYGDQAEPIELSSVETSASTITVDSGGFGVVVLGTWNALSDTDGLAITDCTDTIGQVNAAGDGMLAIGYTDTSGTWDPEGTGVTIDLQYKAQLIAAAFELT